MKGHIRTESAESAPLDEVSGNAEPRNIEPGRRTMLQYSLASAVSALLGSCNKKNIDASRRTICPKYGNPNIDFKVCGSMFVPHGKVVYKTPENNQKHTVFAVKMIHSSGSFPEMTPYIHKQYEEIMKIYETLYSMGVRHFGGEGFDLEEVNKDRFVRKDVVNSAYPFVRFENLHGENICSFGFDDTQLLRRTYELLKQNQPLEALKLNPERTLAMAAQIKIFLDDKTTNTICITTGGDHLQNSEPALAEFAGKETVANLLEEWGIRVVIVEPSGYKEINKKISRLK